MTRLASISVLLLAVAAIVSADTWDTAPPAFTKPHDLPAQDLLNMRGADRPTPLSQVNIEQKLNTQLPLDAVFKDDHGTDGTLRQYFDGRHPVVRSLVYY